MDHAPLYLPRAPPPDEYFGHVHNDDGHRVAKAVNGSETRYTLDVAVGLVQVLVETTKGESTAYLYGHDLLGEEGTAWAWHLNDGLGSVRQLTDEDGQVDEATYSLFGVPDDGDAGALHGYTGERWYGGVGLLYLRARYYDPGTGRFISADTIVPEPSNPQNFNRYAYVGNNPLKFIDSSGHSITGTILSNPIEFEPFKLGSTGVKVLDALGQAAIMVGYSLAFGVCKVEGKIGDAWLKPTSDIEFTLSRWQASLLLVTPLSMPDAALSLADYSFEFQYEVVPEAKTYVYWEETGLSGPTFPNFPEAFESAMNNAPRIHFNLTGIEDVNVALELGRCQGWGPGNMTNTELYLIVNNPDWFAKTTFYINKVALSLTEVSRLFGGP